MRKSSGRAASSGSHMTGSSEHVGTDGVNSHMLYKCVYCKESTGRLDLYYELPLHLECSEKKQVEDLTFFDLFKLTKN